MTTDTPYVPVHPTKVEVVVTLSNGKTATVEIDEDSSIESGDLYGALFPAGVLIGHLSRQAQRDLRESRIRAEAYPDHTGPSEPPVSDRDFYEGSPWAVKS